MILCGTGQLVSDLLYMMCTTCGLESSNTPSFYCLGTYSAMQRRWDYKSWVLESLSSYAPSREEHLTQNMGNTSGSIRSVPVLGSPADWRFLGSPVDYWMGSPVNCLLPSCMFYAEKTYGHKQKKISPLTFLYSHAVCLQYICHVIDEE